MLQTYNVALKAGIDYNQFWDEIETVGADSGHVPERAVDIINERPTSLRQCWYELTDEEAQKLRDDPRVFCVEIPPEFRHDIKVEGSATQTGLWYKDVSNVNPANNEGINWGLFRLDSRTNNTPGYPAEGILDHDYLYDGTGVDFVIMDGGIQADHPDFTDANGVSRVQRIDWYAESGVPGTMPSFETFYSDYNGHGTLCTAPAVGKIYGPAKNARIYCMTVNIDRVAPTTFISVSEAFDCIKGWHLNKPIDPTTGFPRPTVLNMSFGYRKDYEDITGGVYRGAAWVGTTGQTQYAMTGSNNDGTGNWGVRVDSVDTDIEELTAAGVHTVTSAGNSYQIVDVEGGQDYDNYYTSNTGGVIEQNYYMRGGSPLGPEMLFIGGVTAFFTNPERVYPLSSKGPRIDVFPPAVAIVTAISTVNTAGASTAYPTNSDYYIGVFNGTSISSPMIAGIMCQMLQAFPSYRPATIRQMVKDYATLDVLYDAGSPAYTNSFRLHGAVNRYAYMPYSLETWGPIDDSQTPNWQPVNDS